MAGIWQEAQGGASACGSCSARPGWRHGSTSNAALPCAGSSWTQEQPAAPGAAAHGHAGDEAQEGGGDEEREAAEGAGLASGDPSSVQETLEGGAPSDTAMVGTALLLPAPYSFQAVKHVQRATYCGAYWLTPEGDAVTRAWHAGERSWRRAGPAWHGGHRTGEDSQMLWGLCSPLCEVLT